MELRRAMSADMTIGRVEARRIEQVEERERGVEPGGTGAVIRKIPKSLKLSLRGSVERQAQHRLDRLSKPRTGSVGPIGEAEYVNPYADRCEGRPVWCRNREAVRKIFREEYIWEFV